MELPFLKDAIAISDIVSYQQGPSQAFGNPKTFLNYPILNLQGDFPVFWFELQCQVFIWGYYTIRNIKKWNQEA